MPTTDAPSSPQPADAPVPGRVYTHRDRWSILAANLERERADRKYAESRVNGLEREVKALLAELARVRECERRALADAAWLRANWTPRRVAESIAIVGDGGRR